MRKTIDETISDAEVEKSQDKLKKTDPRDVNQTLHALDKVVEESREKERAKYRMRKHLSRASIAESMS